MRSIRLGSLLGIPLLVNPGWFVIAALTAWVLARQVFPALLPEAGWRTHATMAVVSAAAFFTSIVLHELAHGIVARRIGLPVRSITLFLFGGVAHVGREASRPLHELLMAAAGPLLSLVLGAALAGGWWLAGAHTSSPLAVAVAWTGWMNLVLGVFNLLPAYPMDGGRIFRSAYWLLSRDRDRATTVAAWLGRGFGWALAAAGAASLAGVDVRIVAGPLGGAWLVLVGLFLENGARQSLVQLGYGRELNRFSVRDVMLADPPLADPDRTLGAFAAGVATPNQRFCFFVHERGALTGIFSSAELHEVPRAHWDRVTVRQAMVPSDRLSPVAPGEKLADVLLTMEDGDLMHVPVVDQGRVVGVVGRERIVGVLQRAGLVDAR